MSNKIKTHNKVISGVKAFMAVPEFVLGSVVLGMMVGALISTYFNYLR